MTRHSIHDVQHPTAENPDDGIVARAIDLTKVYGSKDNEVMALDHVNVEFKRGEMTAIMGPSGSGKSTLMHCMAGLDTPSSGKVIVEGLEVSSMNQKQLTDLRREQIGFIFQSFKCSNTERSRYLRKPYAICPSRFPFQNTLEDGGCTAYLYISGMVLLIHESKQYLRSGTVGGTCICTRYDAFYRSFDLRLSPCTTAYASVPTRKKIAAHIWCGCVRHPRCIRIDRRHGDRAIVLSEFITCRI